ncbi:MAG: hypothetical protein DWQ53_09880 [Microcystis flos-aquae DF17]|nr:MAG: hypothetical protein DWQ53_09880 [Microcystis flos-aquae DF17]
MNFRIPLIVAALLIVAVGGWFAYSQSPQGREQRCKSEAFSEMRRCNASAVANRSGGALASCYRAHETAMERCALSPEALADLDQYEAWAKEKARRESDELQARLEKERKESPEGRKLLADCVQAKRHLARTLNMPFDEERIVRGCGGE